MICRFVLFISLSFSLSICYSQTASNKKTTKKRGELAWDLRNYTVFTCIKSQRLEDLVQRVWDDLKKKDSSRYRFFFVEDIRLSDSDFHSLSPAEKFIFAHQYPESYLQTCGLYDMASDISMIHANIPYMFDGERMSERQIKSLLDNRDSTLGYLSDCIDFRSHIPLGYKKTIIEINAWEFIPSILSLEEKMNKGDTTTVEDPYIYSVLLELMKNNEFADFKKTAMYNKLYGPDAGYREKIAYTAAIRNKIRELSQKLYMQKAAETK
ncbi:MAG TPA: hypothetical protein VFI06_17520 [Chitinophagaceae bacterium]|nr:hypothetical protein [Chitinophagaceae bacterium]